MELGQNNSMWKGRAPLRCCCSSVLPTAAQLTGSAQLASACLHEPLAMLLLLRYWKFDVASSSCCAPHPLPPKPMFT